MLLFQRYDKNKRLRSEGKESEQDQGVLCKMHSEGLLDGLMEDYISYCANHTISDMGVGKAKIRARFPNPAGFCRYLNTGLSDMSALASVYPHEYDRLLAVFEDEALNSEVSPTLLSTYLKKRLCYASADRDSKGEEEAKEARYCFEHDIFKDGE